jgi:hypothetical protein
MYSVADLAKIYNTTRKTIYKKMDTPSIKKYIKSTQNGKKLMPEGFNEFQLLMSMSRVYTKSDSIHEVKSQKTEKVDIKDMYTKEHINDLKQQIEELKNDKLKLFEELQNKNMLLEKALITIENSQNILKESTNRILLLESNNKENLSWWKFWKKTNKNQSNISP